MTKEEKKDLAQHLLDIVQTPNANRIVYRPYFRIFPDEYWLWHSETVVSYPFSDIFARYYPQVKGYLTVGVSGKDAMLLIISDDVVTPLTDEMWNNDDFINELKNCKATPIKYVDTFDGKSEKDPNVPIAKNCCI